MGYSNNIITQPISVRDAQLGIPSNSNDVGGLCTSANIHKWSKFKPFRHSVPGFTSDNGTAVATDRLYSLRQANCGFSIPTASSKETILTDCLTKEWTYNRPRGLNGGGAGVHEWYNLLDFHKYCSIQNAPFDYIINTDSVYFFDDPKIIKRPESIGTVPVDGDYAIEDFPNTLGSQNCKLYIVYLNNNAQTNIPQLSELSASTSDPQNIPFVPITAGTKYTFVFSPNPDAANPVFYLLPHTLHQISNTGGLGIVVNGGVNQFHTWETDAVKLNPTAQAEGSSRTIYDMKILWRKKDNFTKDEGQPAWLQYTINNPTPDNDERLNSFTTGEYVIGNVNVNTSSATPLYPSGEDYIELRITPELNIRTSGQLFYAFKKTVGGRYYYMPLGWREQSDPV